MTPVNKINMPNSFITIKRAAALTLLAIPALSLTAYGQDKPQDARPAARDSATPSSKGAFVWPEAEAMPQVLEKAAKNKDLVLALFTGDDWCGPCMGMEKQVFSTPGFRNWAESKAGLQFVRINLLEKHPFASNEQKAAVKRLNDEYQISGWPTILLLDSRGTLLARLGDFDFPRTSGENFCRYVDERLQIIGDERQPEKIAGKIKAHDTAFKEAAQKIKAKSKLVWESDYIIARDKARKAGKPLLVRPRTGTGDEIRFDANVLLQPDLDTWLAEHCIAVEISVRDSHFDAVHKLLRVNGPPPACAFVDPKTLEPVSETFTDAWSPETARKILEAGKKAILSQT